MAGMGAGRGSERLTQEVESKYKKWQKKKITMRKEHLYDQSRAPGNFGKDNEEEDSTQ